MSIDQELINQLVEARVDRDRCCLEGVLLPQEYLLGRSRHTADVRVREIQDVLAVRLALVGSREVGHFGAV